MSAVKVLLFCLMAKENRRIDEQLALRYWQNRLKTEENDDHLDEDRLKTNNPPQVEPKG